MSGVITLEQAAGATSPEAAGLLSERLANLIQPLLVQRDMSNLLPEAEDSVQELRRLVSLLRTRAREPDARTAGDLSDEELKQLEDLQRGATRRPWKFDEMEVYVFGPAMEMVADTMTDGETTRPGEEVALRVRGHGARLPQRVNGYLMCAAVNALPRLLPELRRRRGR